MGRKQKISNKKNNENGFQEKDISAPLRLHVA